MRYVHTYVLVSISVSNNSKTFFSIVRRGEGRGVGGVTIRGRRYLGGKLIKFFCRFRAARRLFFEGGGRGK